MSNPAASKYAVSFGVSLALCSVVNALMVIAKERIPAVAAGMQKITGHHWITHSVIVLVLFFGLGLGFAGLNGGRGPNVAGVRLNRIVITGVIAGVVIILGFYLIDG